MEFRDLKTQYKTLKPKIDDAIQRVLTDANFISGNQVNILEKMLADYVGVKHCITCANGTDALMVSLMALNINKEHAVFVPDFTFFASGEAPAFLGATPIFVDIDKNTYNIDPVKLEVSIQKVIEEGKLIPKVIIPVDLFGQTADYSKIREIASRYNLIILEDGAQSFGARYYGKRACSLGDIAITSFFPAKPLGCYGDGGAIFTDNDEYASIIRSICVHGKGRDKYHNVRIGMNSRLDTIQAAILIEKLKAFDEYELNQVNKVADEYSRRLTDKVKRPIVSDEYFSSWAQYTICVYDEHERDEIKKYLGTFNIPTNIYYPVPMHKQEAFSGKYQAFDVDVTEEICKKVISLPIGPYMKIEEVYLVCEKIADYYNR